MKINTVKYKIVFFLSLLSFLQVCYSQGGTDSTEAVVCKWSKNFPRRQVTLNGCGKTKTNFCSGYVVCGENVKLATCSPDHCNSGEDDSAEECLKDTIYESVITDGSPKDYAAGVKKMIVGPKY